jgi:hypothetical protein
MVLGVLLQGLLLSGHIPFVHRSSFLAHPAPVEQYQTEVAVRDQSAILEARMHRPNFQTGMIFPQWGTNAYDSSDSNWQIGLHDIAYQTGAQWIELPINLYQSSVYSTQVSISEITPTPDAVAAGISKARAMNYHVFIVPLLSVGGILTWSGSIQFSTIQHTQQWFDSYWQAYQPYVIAAAQAGAEELAIGTEFEKLQSAPADLWNQLIDRIHKIFPGKLTYDMNWSSLYNPIPSWMIHNPSLSAMGISVYIPLTDIPKRLDPALLPELWQEKIGKLLDSFAVQIRMPVFISEIGYRDSAFALYRPWERDARAQAEPVDHEEQAAAYNAALTNTIADPHIIGIYFWAWSVPLFEPNWKPAARVLYMWYTSPQA